MENNNKYLGYIVKNGVLVKDKSLDGEPERLNKPYGYLLKNINPCNVNARLTRLYNAQEKIGHAISRYTNEGLSEAALDEEYNYHCVVDVIEELRAYRSTQDWCAVEGDPEYRI